MKRRLTRVLAKMQLRRGFLSATLVLWIFFGCSSCGGDSDGIKHEVAIFVQTTSNSDVNEKITKEYVFEVVNALFEVKGGVRLHIYPITANTITASSVYSVAIRPGLKGMNDRDDAVEKEADLRKALNQVYAGGRSELVDVLGAVFIIDQMLGGRKTSWFGQQPITAIFVTDLMQRSGVNGWDFGPYALDSQNLDACKRGLESNYGARLGYRARFAAEVRVLILKLDLGKLYSDVESRSLPPVHNAVEVDGFWRDDFFGKLLSTQVTIDASNAPGAAVRRFMD